LNQSILKKLLSLNNQLSGDQNEERSSLSLSVRSPQAMAILGQMPHSFGLATLPISLLLNLGF